MSFNGHKMQDFIHEKRACDSVPYALILEISVFFELSNNFISFYRLFCTYPHIRSFSMQKRKGELPSQPSDTMIELPHLIRERRIYE